MRRNTVYAIVLLALAALALFLFLRPRAAPEAPPVTRDTSTARTSAPTPPSAAPAPASARATAPDRAAARARRDELRARIVRALEERARTPGATVAAQPASDEQPARPPGNLVDRTGRGRDALLQRLNQDFMPLAQECIEQAQERLPTLAGMFIIAIETVADDHVGAVVDLADAAPRNQVADAELVECIRESAFSLSLPPPPEGGREQFEVSMPIKPERGP